MNVDESFVLNDSDVKRFKLGRITQATSKPVEKKRLNNVSVKLSRSRTKTKKASRIENNPYENTTSTVDFNNTSPMRQSQ